MLKQPAHITCIIGGAVAGSEAASQLAEQGVYSVVIDMGTLPYGKIELGLPKWHAKQRVQEEALIDRKLCHPLVTFVPNTQLGIHISLEKLLDWGFSAILLAVGAWKDRPLAVPGIDKYIGRGFEYQNPLVAWFNQYHSPSYDGPDFNVVDRAAVIGGGLASIDVVKILMLESVQRKLEERGYQVDTLTLEKKGIPKTLESLGIAWEDLSLKGCTLYYRRRACDMPLVPMEGEITPQKLAKAQKVRVKLLETARKKYLFRFKPCHLPVEAIVTGDCLTGLVFLHTKVESGKATPVSGTESVVKSPLTISSIGSIPEPLPGVPMDRELFQIEDSSSGKVAGFENVFALGNAVTGRGNIRASRIHGKQVSNWVLANVLPQKIKKRSPKRIGKILRRVEELQRRAGFDGNYANWAEKHRPARLDEMN